MEIRFDTPSEAEDAFYDAIEAGDLAALMGVWDRTPDIICLLPMRPLQSGHKAIETLWQPMLDATLQLDITVNHLQWCEHGDIAIHLLEELATIKGDPQQPIYASNTYRRSEDGWRLLIHINSPMPPPSNQLPPLG